MYIYTLVCCDIGYAITFLVRFALHPSKAHYHALEHIAHYLQATETWGIVYHRQEEPLAQFPVVPLPDPLDFNDLPDFPYLDKL